MEDNKTTETAGVTADKVETFKTFKTEEEYNNFEKSLKSKGKNELLEKYGIKSFDEIDSKLAKIKEQEDAQKSDLEKANEQLQSWEEKYNTLSSQLKDRDLTDAIKGSLKDLNVDDKYASKIKKLINTDEIYGDDGLKMDKLNELVSQEAQDLNLTEKKERIQVGKEVKDNKQPEGKKSGLDLYKEMKSKGKF